MKILSSAQMKAVDRATIEDIGIPGPVLMENAGLQIVRLLLDRFPRPAEERIVVVAGKGNNGGDGLVVSRHLFNAGGKPKIFLLGKKDELRGEAAINLGIVLKLGLPVVEAPDAGAWAGAGDELKAATVIIDAVFGTGLAKPAAGFHARVIEDINKAPGFTLAVDIPSGLSADTFEVIGPCVMADLTVTLAALKIAHVFPPAEDYVGDLAVVDISTPPFLLDRPELKLELVDRERMVPYFKKRPRSSHKGSYGHLLVIAGSFGKTGAAAMAGKAALKMGAGLVTVATAASGLPAVARSMMELMTEPLEETPAKSIAKEALPRVVELLEGKSGLVLGPGLTTHPSTTEFVRLLIPRIKVPAVIDADGLNIIASDPDMLGQLKSLPGPVVLTPHPGEFARLADRPIPEVLARRLEMAPAFAEKHGVYLVLKGYRTLVAAPDGRVFVNPTGNPGMASGGSGDVLSGFVGSEIVQEKDALEAVLAAVYVHGLSGDMGSAKVSEKFLTAGDIIRFLPQALKSLESE